MSLREVRFAVHNVWHEIFIDEGVLCRYDIRSSAPRDLE